MIKITNRDIAAAEYLLQHHFCIKFHLQDILIIKFTNSDIAAEEDQLIYQFHIKLLYFKWSLGDIAVVGRILAPCLTSMINFLTSVIRQYRRCWQQTCTLVDSNDQFSNADH